MHRVKIANSNILKYLIDHAQGKREMSPSQAQVGIALLRKVMPDLTATEHTGEIEHRVTEVRWVIADAPQKRLEAERAALTH